MGYLNNSGLKHLWDSIKNLFIKKESFEDAGITSKTYTEIDSETVTTALGAVHPKPYATLSDGPLTEAKMYRVTIGNDEYELPCYTAVLAFPDLNKVALMLFIGNPTYFDGNDDYIGHYWDVPFLISNSVIASSGSEPVKNGPYLFTSSAQTVEITIEEIAYTGKVVPGYLIDGGNPDLVEQNESDLRSSSFGYNRIARSTRGSAAIGTANKVTGNYGVAIGTGCEAGSSANAIGIYAKATGYYAISIGWKTDASGAAAFASGARTVASGNQSSTFGNRTIANHKGQFVFGEYNEADPSSAAATARGNYVEIVGNGTATDARSNARTLDWDGNERLAGGITLGDGTADETTITPEIAKSLIAGSSGNKVHLVGMDSITWDAGVTSAIGEVSETRAQILSWLNSGDLVFLNVGDSGDPIWLFPHSDDTSDIYFSSVMYDWEYYKASFSDGYTTTQITVNLVKIAQVPSGGSVGQVLTKTANGYAWQNLPVYN